MIDLKMQRSREKAANALYRNDELEKAAMLYKKNVDEGFKDQSEFKVLPAEGIYPHRSYIRLAVILRQLGRKDQEILVLRSAVNEFAGTSCLDEQYRSKQLDRFRKRLSNLI